jgi:multidrug transporter EmrE-like cation transporter
MREAMFLALAALLEVGGDACVRWGLKSDRLSGRCIGLALGAVVLFGYGLSVNLPKWDFGRLMGVYIAAFFIVAQAAAVIFFNERLHSPTIVGGLLIIAGGVVMTVWRVQ